jgi:hypothetical protein
MNQKYSTTLFLPMNEIVNQPARKNNFHLSFVTILVSIVAGSHTAIAQTVSADQNEYRPLDRLLIAHQHLSTQGSGNSENFHLPNSAIAGEEHHSDRKHHGDRHHVMPPDIQGESNNTQHSIMPTPRIDDGRGNRTPEVVNHIIMPKPHIDTNENRKNPAKTSRQH